MVGIQRQYTVGYLFDQDFYHYRKQAGERANNITIRALAFLLFTTF